LCADLVKMIAEIQPALACAMAAGRGPARFPEAVESS
jgi:hypothetical protein